LHGALPRVFCIAPRNFAERAGRERKLKAAPPELEKIRVYVLLVAWLGSRARCGYRGVEEGAALRDLSGALRHEPPHVLRRHPGVALGRPYVRLAGVEGSLGQTLALTRANLREGC
jgi:hypothetical protein